MDEGRSLLEPQDLDEPVHCIGESHRRALDHRELLPGRNAGNRAGENIMRADDHLQRLPQVHCHHRGCTEIVVYAKAVVFDYWGTDMGR